MVTNWWISCVRTIVAPLVVGALFQWLIITLASNDPGFFIRSVSFVAGAFAYYVISRVAQDINPYLGALLVVAITPSYFNDEDEEQDPLATSIRRTLIPFAVGWALALLVRWLFDLSEVTGIVVMCATTAAFYGGMRWIEERSVAGTRTREVAGVLLGAPMAPHY